MTDTLWAPWRIDYIRAPRDRSAGCLFCGYAGEAPSAENGVLVRWPNAYVVLNRYPYASAHVMVVPVRHARELRGLDGHGEHDGLFQLVTETVEALRAAVSAGGFNVGLNLGHVAGAGIEEHLHVHVVPRWAGDQNFMPVIADTRVMPEHIEATWRHLRPFFEPLEGRGP